MRVKFFVDGSKRKGTAIIDLKKVSWKIGCQMGWGVEGCAHYLEYLFWHASLIGVTHPLARL